MRPDFREEPEYNLFEREQPNFLQIWRSGHESLSSPASDGPIDPQVFVSAE